MTEPYDPNGPDWYRRNPNDPYDPYGQPGGQPYGGQFGGAQSYGGQQPQGGQYEGGQYEGQQYEGGPYQGGPYQGGQTDPTVRFEPYGTRPYEPYPTQQPYQGSYGRPAGWSGPGDFPPRPPRKSRAPLIIGAVLAVLLLIGGVAAAVALTGNDTPSAGPAGTTARSAQPTGTGGPASSRQSTGDDFEVGQCATLTPQENNRATIRVTECGGLLSDVVIAKVQVTECPEPYLSFDPRKGKVYCLAMDAKEGDCFKLDQLIKRAIACSGDGTRKVLKIVDGVADEKKCDAVPEVIDVYAYQDPPKTLCLGKADF